MQGGLSILDITHPATPTPVGFYSLRPGPGSLALAGDYAYVATNWGSGIQIINIAQPGAPVKSGAFPATGEIRAMAVDGHYAYFLNENTEGPPITQAGLHIVDVANPKAPAEVGYLSLIGCNYEIALAGHYIYVGGMGPGLQVIDIADPAAPKEIGNSAAPSGTVDLEVQGRYLYTAGYSATPDSYSMKLNVFDAAKPQGPEEVGAYAIAAYFPDIAVAGNYIYLADEESGLLILRLLQDQVTAVIPAEGGNLLSTERRTQLLFSAGGFAQTALLTYDHLLNDQKPGGLEGISQTFDVRAIYSDTHRLTQPNQPYTISIQYRPAEIAPAIESTLALYYWEAGQWKREPTSLVDVAAHTLTATPRQVSLWAVLGDSQKLFLPLVAGHP